MIAEKIRLRRNAASAREGPLMPDELRKAEMSWIRNAQNDLKSRISNNNNNNNNNNNTIFIMRT